jgi:hypothetical protein
LRFRLLLSVLPKLFLTTEWTGGGARTGIAGNVVLILVVTAFVVVAAFVVVVVNFDSSVAVLLVVLDETRYSTRPCCFAIANAFFISRSRSLGQSGVVFVLLFFGSPRVSCLGDVFT